MFNKINEFQNYLVSEEKSSATVRKYTHDVAAFVQWLNGVDISKIAVREYKVWLMNEYLGKSVNSILSSLNSFFDWLDHPEYKVKNLKIQKMHLQNQIATLQKRSMSVCSVWHISWAK